MNNNGNTAQRAMVLWLSGIQLADMREIAEVETLVKGGAMVELLPSPITGPQTQAYQAFSGRSPASSGFFDTVVPRGYSLKEEVAGPGPSPKLLPDLLRTVGWTVQYQEVRLSELVVCLQSWTQTASASPAGLIVKCVVETGFDASALSQALQLARTWIGESGLLALFSDTHPAPVARFVNVNNFLADVGVLERDEQSGGVNWSNSLAYHAGHGQLWVNLLGRDGQGAVHPQGEYEEVRESLVKALPNRLRDDGLPVIERVYRREDLYTSEYLFRLPDLIVVFAPGYAPSVKSTRLEFDATTFTTPASGTTVIAGVHPSSVMGFLLASAPAFAAGIALSEAAPLTSVVPTLLHSLGVEFFDMETSAVSGLFRPSYLEEHPVRSNTQNQELSEEDEERIINHLRDLGYV